MDFETFERYAIACWRSIPARYREGVSALVVRRDAFRKEEFRDGWVYGWCEEDPVVMAVPDAPVTSRITLFHGSFVHLAAEDPAFDWEGEVWETVRHELQHHLEWRAGLDHLGDEDDLQDENERRVQGLPFRSGFHRDGLALGGDAWLADGDLFVERGYRKRDWARLAQEGPSVTWDGWALTAPPLPVELLDDGGPIYVPASVDAPPDPDGAPSGALWRDPVLVLWRRRGWFG